MRVSVVSLAVFAISRLKSMGRIGIARAVASALDWPRAVPVSVQWALSALPVSVRVSVAYRAIGAAPAPNPPGAWREYLAPMNTTNYCKDHMTPAGFWSAPTLPTEGIPPAGELAPQPGETPAPQPIPPPLPTQPVPAPAVPPTAPGEPNP